MLKALDRVRLIIGRDHTLGTIMERLAAVHGGRRLVEEADGGLRLTYQQASKRVNRWAGGIRRKGVQPGDRVVVAAPNGYEALLLCLAAARVGALPVPVNPQMRREEVAHVARDSEASLTLRAAVEVDGADPVIEAVPVDPAGVAALFYTSGTTGAPKGVELSHRSLLGSTSGAAAWPTRLRRDEVVLSLPIAHIMGFVSVLGLACAGIPVYFLPRFHPVAVLDAIESRRATIFVGVPAMYRMLLEAGAEERDLRSVRVWISGADAMPPDLAERFKRLGATVTLPLVGSFGEAAFAEGYGMVELGGGAAAKVSPPWLGFGLGSGLGLPLPGYKFRVVDEEGEEVQPGQVGELLVKGPGVTKGYWGDPEATAAAVTDDGWLRTGDLARRGMFGMVVFEGRKKHVIKHGGYSVYALEVERALEEHPDVAEAAVVGLPDERKGEVPAAVVRLAPDVTFDAGALQRWAAERLAEYKVPVRIVVADELPRTATNKTQKQQLLALFDT